VAPFISIGQGGSGRKKRGVFGGKRNRAKKPREGLARGIRETDEKKSERGWEKGGFKYKERGCESKKGDMEVISGETLSRREVRETGPGGGM